MNRADPRATFWICTRCATPNPRAGYLTHCVACGAVRPQDGQAAKPERSPRRRPPDDRPAWRRHLGRWTLVAGWVYAFAMAALVGMIALAGDRWWPTTVALFGPRWVVALPLGLIVPIALLSRRWATLPPILVAAILVVGPWMGFRLPWGRSSGGLLSLRVLTCNVEGGRAVGLAALVEATSPDIVVLQECPPGWPAQFFPAPTWTVRQDWGIAIASRLPIRGQEFRPLAVPYWEGGTVGRVTIETKIGAVDVHGVHLETPREGLESLLHGKFAGVPDLRTNIERRRKQAADASRWVGESPHPVLVAGDFNLPTDSTIYRESWSGYLNAFSTAGLGFGLSKWTRWIGVRIDHILGGTGWGVRACWVGPDVGSDHRPVIADLHWNASRD